MGLRSAYRRCRFWQKKIIFSDEAHFDPDGCVNKQNCHIWGTENPHAYIEKPTHPKRVTLWCEFWSRGIIGIFFFENEQGEAVTVNGDRYRDMLNEFFSQKLRRRILTKFGFNRTALYATQRCTRYFAPCFWRWHYQPQSCCRLATSELRFDTVGLLFVGCRQRQVLGRQARDNWCEAIGEIQLHAIDNVLKHWTDCVG